MSARNHEEKKRKTVMLDFWLVESLKRIAASHGMTLSSYLRAVLSGIIEAENNNIFAPMMLRRILVYTKLRRADMVLVPLTLLDADNLNEDYARKEGERLGVLLRSLGLDLREAIDLLLENTRILLRERDRYIILPPTRRGEKLLIALVEGICRSYGKEIGGDESVRIIEFQHGE